MLSTGRIDRRLENVKPKSFIRRNWCLSPLRWPAFTAGMLSENWSAFRMRTGPRSSRSAWIG